MMYACRGRERNRILLFTFTIFTPIAYVLDILKVRRFENIGRYTPLLFFAALCYKILVNVGLDDHQLTYRYTRFFIPFNVTCNVQDLRVQVVRPTSKSSKKDDHFIIYRNGKKLLRLDRFALVDEDDFELLEKEFIRLNVLDT